MTVEHQVNAVLCQSICDQSTGHETHGTVIQNLLDLCRDDISLLQGAESHQGQPGAPPPLARASWNHEHVVLPVRAAPSLPAALAAAPCTLPSTSPYPSGAWTAAAVNAISGNCLPCTLPALSELEEQLKRWQGTCSKVLQNALVL